MTQTFGGVTHTASAVLPTDVVPSVSVHPGIEMNLFSMQCTRLTTHPYTIFYIYSSYLIAQFKPTFSQVILHRVDPS